MDTQTLIRQQVAAQNAIRLNEQKIRKFNEEMERMKREIQFHKSNLNLIERTLKSERI